MKQNATEKSFPTTDAEWDSLIADAPDAVDDQECPYDPNDPEAVAAFWKNAVITKGGGPAAVREALEKRRQGERGPQKTPTKIPVTIRLDQHVLEHFKASGKGWQTRLNQALVDLVSKDHAA